MSSISIIRIFFLMLCTAAGYAVSQVRPELLNASGWWTLIGFGFGGLLIAIEELIRGFSLRAFSAATFGLVLGSLCAWMIDRSGLFVYADGRTAWLIRLCLFIGFGYIGIVLAMRSNKEDFTLIIPFVRFQPRHEPDNILLLDTSAIIDGRIAELLACQFLEGVVVVPRFVLKELHQVADSEDPIKRERGRHGLSKLSDIQKLSKLEVRIHEADVPGEDEVDAKLVHLSRTLVARLITCDYNLSKIAELHGVPCLRINDLANALKKTLIPGEILRVRIVREGKEKGQGVGYLNDGTMIVVNNAQRWLGKEKDVQVTSLLQTGAGVIVFADLKESQVAQQAVGLDT